MDAELRDELRAGLAAARRWLAEYAEEGIELRPVAPATPAPNEPDPNAAETTPAADDAAKATPEPVATSSEPVARAPEPLTLLEEPAPFPPGASLDDVREALGDCQRCRLSEGRTQIVFGDGNPQADLMFVGEGPGAEEDRRGLPFVGRAGELLTAMIEKGLGIPRSEVYIANIVKCRPPNNRTPLADEAQTCSPYLHGQIAAVQPKVIIALGKPATSLLLGRDVAITRIRGQWHEYRGIPLMPTLHPAFVLRQYTEANRRAVWEDLKAASAKASETPST
ncbi:MAG: uracil-DNA glycosylase family protein [Myxococcota bacterium]